MGEDARTAIAEAIVDIDRAMAQLSPSEQDRLMRRRLALVEVLRSDAGRQSNAMDPRLQS